MTSPGARRATVAVTAIAVLLAGVAAIAQSFGGYRQRYTPIEPNASYDGKFTFVRLRYGPPVRFAALEIPWSHDYPLGEQHFMRIMNDITYLNPHLNQTDILPLDAPELFKYPIAYMAEPGYWDLSEEEATSFRAYLQKGGFVIFDDFAPRRGFPERGGGWGSFEYAFRQVLPNVKFVDLDVSQQIFHVFYEISSFDIIPQAYDEGRPFFRGVFEDNDPTKRLIAMINYNTDVSEYWEWSDTGLKPIDESNEAYKLGVNYIIYGMTH
jgi:hypothetical protein